MPRKRDDFEQSVLLAADNLVETWWIEARSQQTHPPLWLRERLARDKVRLIHAVTNLQERR